DRAEPDGVVMGALLRATVALGKVGDIEKLLDRLERSGWPSEAVKRGGERAQSIVRRRAQLAKTVKIPAGKEADVAPALDALACAEGLAEEGHASDAVEA